MLSYIRRKFFLIKRWIERLLDEQRHPEFIDLGAQSKYKFNNNLVIHSFYNNEYILAYHKNDPDDNLIRLPINLPLHFCIDDLEEELNRYIFLKDCESLFGKKYKTRKLVIYHNNPLLVGLIEKIIERGNYGSYHIFCNSAETFNNMKFLAQKNKTVRLNDIESNLASMLRVIRNEYEDLYNDIDTRTTNEDDYIFFSRNNSITEICCAINWNNNCYICLPYNRFLYYSLIFLYRYYNKIDMIKHDNNFMLLKVTKLSTLKNHTVGQTMDHLYKIYKKIVKIILY